MLRPYSRCRQRVKPRSETTDMSSRIGLAEMVENKDRRFGAALEGTV